MIRILKASAGSGKTFNLAETYIRLLLEKTDPRSYRHILAVTFTNKATDEMKSRILKELHQLSTDPSGSQYTKDLVPSVCSSELDLKKRSEDVLFNILHDYSAFAVSTIDRFFQQTLKAFSREIGQFASYQVELDKDSLVEESVDRILDSLTEDDKALLGWLSESMMDQLEQGKRFSVDSGLKDIGKRLKSDEHRVVVEKYGIDDEQAYSKDNLKKMKSLFRKAVSDYSDRVKAAAKEVEKAFEQAGVSPMETYKSFLGNYLSKFETFDKSKLPEMKPAFRKRVSCFEDWTSKAMKDKFAGLESALTPSVAAFVSTYDSVLKPYNTACILLDQINDLGIASDLYREFRSLMKEKNVLSLDDSNLLLKIIIDGSDAPFVYEKLGVRFENFLLDEFQDTSRVQWDNFKPLIANSDAGGYENLLVGDVKQSIYRWRGSDWNLMAREVRRQFPKAVEDSLEGNWRSLSNVVEFNNGFFAFASAALDNLYGPGSGISVSEIYGRDSDSGEYSDQKVMSRDASSGSVEAVFCDPEDELDIVLATIRKLIDAGAKASDITVLVRYNREGSCLANFLMDNGLDVISDDSLLLKSSMIVRKLVSLISSVKNPGDTIGSYLARQAGLDVSSISFHSLPDLCEQLLRQLRKTEKEEVFDGEAQYVQSFMDYVQDHVSVNGNSPDSFLQAWDAAEPNVSSPSDADAVRVMTIHKSKGLEFPYVIIPFAEKVGLSSPEHSWVVPDVSGTFLEGAGKAAFNVQLSGKSSQTLFAEDYRKELLLQYIDNINTFYVAMTRPSKGLTVIADIESKPESNFAGILHRYLDEYGQGAGFEMESDESAGTVVFRKGELYDFASLERKDAGIDRRETGYPSFPLDPEPGDGEKDVRIRGRLKFSADSVDFFTDEARIAARSNGTVMHSILSEVIVPEDLPSAVLRASESGEIDAGRKEEILRFLSMRIASHPKWFPSEGAEIFNETSLIDVHGDEKRPDRVIIRDGEVTVLDFKFGDKNPHYRRQVDWYAETYRRMGYQKVNSAIWYVNSDEVE